MQTHQKDSVSDRIRATNEWSSPNRSTDLASPTGVPAQAHRIDDEDDFDDASFDRMRFDQALEARAAVIRHGIG